MVNLIIIKFLDGTYYTQYQRSNAEKEPIPNSFPLINNKKKMIMVSFLTNQNLKIFTASFTISGSVCDIKISQIKITKHTAK